jgi:hypothetical protein
MESSQLRNVWQKKVATDSLNAHWRIWQTLRNPHIEPNITIASASPTLYVYPWYAIVASTLDNRSTCPAFMSFPSLVLLVVMRILWLFSGSFPLRRKVDFCGKTQAAFKWRIYKK